MTDHMKIIAKADMELRLKGLKHDAEHEALRAKLVEQQGEVAVAAIEQDVINGMGY